MNQIKGRPTSKYQSKLNKTKTNSSIEELLIFDKSNQKKNARIADFAKSPSK